MRIGAKLAAGDTLPTPAALHADAAECRRMADEAGIRDCWRQLLIRTAEEFEMWAAELEAARSEPRRRLH